jgi:hypothetical protein
MLACVKEKKEPPFQRFVIASLLHFSSAAFFLSASIFLFKKKIKKS